MKKMILIGAVVALAILLLFDFSKESNQQQTKKAVTKDSSSLLKQPKKKVTRNYRVQKERTKGKSLTQADLLKRDRSELSPEVLMIAGISKSAKKLTYNDRMDAIEALTTSLEHGTIEFLRAFLKVPYDENCGLKAIGYNAIKNDVLEVLLRQQSLVEGIGTDLVEAFHDQNTDEMWRDYAIQFMEMYYGQALSQQNENNYKAVEAELTEIEATYFAGIQEVNSTIAGTSLIGLQTVASKDSRVDMDSAVTAAVAIVNDSSIPDYNRMTALRICGDSESEEIRDSVLELVQVGESMPLRIVAVSTLGDMGNKDDISLLVDVKAQVQDANLKKVIDTAIAKLEKK
ncbi:MAG: hypothetical protein KAG98_06770 [Lentisphaeria bacterium]|nr:hypothetical protein [Lentisphaeria bacterium]